MKRNTIILLPVACSFSFVCCEVPNVRACTDDTPNILLIFSDDHGVNSISAYGGPLAEVAPTPNIDRIAKEGILLTDAHHMGAWSGAVCLPSRTMIMTGRSVWRIPGQKNKKAGQQYDAQEVAQHSMAAVFNQAGYDTFRTCKRGNTFKAANEHFAVRHDSKDKRKADPENGSQFHGQRALDFLKQREADSDTDPFLVVPDTAVAEECSTYEEDCPDGQKCMPFANDGGNAWNALKCVDVVGEGGHGDPCTVEGNGVSGVDDTAVIHQI